MSAIQAPLAAECVLIWWELLDLNQRDVTNRVTAGPLQPLGQTPI